ncbi:MAG: DedA family protein [Methylotenera sp.]|jgi:membrane protein DedA with SNARE-associated domain|nr:DedA family protein [Methylotenera sp.]
MEYASSHIFSLFLQYGYIAVFLGVMLDNSGFPMPGEIILLLAGSLVASGDFALAPAVLAAATGALLSDSIWYAIGRSGSRRIIQVYCKMSFGSGACMAKTEAQLLHFGARSLIYARFIPGFRTFAAPMSGMSGVLYRQFFLYDGIGAILWASLGVSVGMTFASQINLFIGHLENSRIVLLYLAGSLLLLFILVKWLIRKRHGRASLDSKYGA